MKDAFVEQLGPIGPGTLVDPGAVPSGGYAMPWCGIKKVEEDVGSMTVATKQVEGGD